MNENEYYNQIKDLIINNEITKRVKEYSIIKSDLETKYEIGKLLTEAGKNYGEGIIKKYSLRLTQELGKGFGLSNLKNMRKYYIVFSKSQAMPDQLSWSHYVELLKVNNLDAINYYIKLTIKNKLSYRELSQKIKSNEYERLSEITKNKLINNDKINIKDSIPEPLLINSNNIIDVNDVNEKILHGLILEDIKRFMDELGEGYAYIGDEYKIKIGNNYNYIDLLLYNIKYKRYVVVELKVVELKKEHIGQIQTYMNYVNKELKTKDENDTIGIIIVKKNNEFIIEYSSDENIISRTYKLTC